MSLTREMCRYLVVMAYGFVGGTVLYLLDTTDALTVLAVCGAMGVAAAVTAHKLLDQEP